MINKESPVPIYYQLKEYMKHKIETKAWQEGDSLPSERVVAEENNISRMTVRQAVTELVNEGVLIREQGKGTYVAEKKIEQKLQSLTSFTEEMKARGQVPGSQLLSFQKENADGATAVRLNMEEGEEVYHIRRIRTGNEQPVAYERTHVKEQFVPYLTEEDVREKSLYTFLEKEARLVISHAEQKIEATLASKDHISYLGLEDGAPILRMLRTTYLTSGDPVEFTESFYRADYYTFQITLPR
ncbi:GntR family transcriptional regulator [Salsuginibacillus kocurii]|uniref:GntR family transcriptional regulator n=1 Tax=Salsuginibacillus kocurii TaxID=427078 RepID=UPI00036AB7C5|nr:GntR family transcriptional regulator [Salsuginibacillus kocurii]